MGTGSDMNRQDEHPGAAPATNGEKRGGAPEPRPVAAGQERSLLVTRHMPETVLRASRQRDERASQRAAAANGSESERPDDIEGELARAVEGGAMRAVQAEAARAVDSQAPAARETYFTAPSPPKRRDPPAERADPREPLTPTRIDVGQRAADPGSGRRAAPLPSGTPVVPPQSVAGRALILVVAIMCFLACLSVGALVLVEDAARDWQLDVAREVTIQVKPVDGQPIEPMLQTAMALAQATAGVRNVRLMSERDSSALLEPWLGPGFDLSQLPVPRLILLELVDPATTDLTGLASQLTAKVKSAILDDHSVWAKRLRTMAGTMVAAGAIVLVLVLVAMVLSVVFATRAAMAGNRDVVEVLHFVGAEDSFIAGEFQHHFLVLGFKGGIGGGLGAILAFLIVGWITRDTPGLSASDQAHALFGGFSLGINAYIGAVGIVLLVAGLTAITSRLTVRSYLNQLD